MRRRIASQKKSLFNIAEHRSRRLCRRPCGGFLGFSLFGRLRIRHKRDNGGGNEKCYGIDQDRPRNSDQSDESTSDR